MTNNKKILAGVGVVALALLGWQASKRFGASPSDDEPGSKVTPGLAKSGGSSTARMSPYTKPNPGAIHGKTIAAGSPVDAVVSLMAIGGDAQLDVDVLQASAGAFAFDGLAPGRYRVSASHTGHLPALSKTIDVSAGATESIELNLKKGGHAIGGTITDISGGPVSTAHVRLTPVAGVLTARPDRSFATITDERGMFATHAADGVYILSASHPDYVTGSRRVEIRGGSGELAMALVPGGAIEGVVRWAASSEPVAGAVVTYRRETISRGLLGGMRQEREAGRVTADEGGKFRITSAGSGLLQLSAETPMGLGKDDITVPLGIAESVTGVELFVSAAVRIEGTVVDKQGKSVANTNVVARTKSRTTEGRSGEDGSFSIGPVFPGTYWMQALAGNRFARERGVEVVVGETGKTGVELVANEAHLMVRGRVTPVRDAEISIAFDKKGASLAMLATAQTDEQGRFELGPVKEGDTLPLRAVGADGSLGELEVKVGATNVDNAVIELKQAASVAGRVVDQQGKPVASATVGLRLKRAGGSRTVMINGAEVSSRRAVSSPDGSFEVRALEAGDYALTVKNDRGQTLLWATAGANNTSVVSEPMKLAIAEREQKTGVTLTVEMQNAKIRGRVLGPNGQPVADAFVTASPSFEFRPPPRSSPGGHPSRATASSGSSDGDGDGDDGESEGESEMMMVVSTGGPGGGPSSAGGFSLELPPVVTGPDGRFVISGLRRGDYDLTAEGLKGTARAFADKVKTGGDITIKLKGLTILEGVVTRNGKPVPRFTIALAGPTTLSREYSDEAGKFTVNRLDPGKYTVTARGDGGESEATIDVTEGDKTQVEIALKVQLKVSGKLIDTEGKPIDKAMIVLTPDRGDGEVNIQIGGNGPPVMTDATGVFEISTLAGDFTLIAVKPSQGPLAMRPIKVTKNLDLGEITADGGRPPQ